MVYNPTQQLYVVYNPIQQQPRGLQPLLAAARGLQPQPAAVRGLQPLLAAVRGLQPQPAAVRGLQPLVAAVRGLQPQPAAVRGLQPLPAGRGGDPGGGKGAEKKDCARLGVIPWLELLLPSQSPAAWPRGSQYIFVPLREIQHFALYHGFISSMSCIPYF